MAARDNPLTPIKTSVAKLQNILIQLTKGVFNKIRSLVRNILKFLKRLKSASKDIIRVIGKSAFNTIMNLDSRFEVAYAMVVKIADRALKTANRILALIKKAADPNKIIKTIKKLVTFFVKQFRMIFHWVREILSLLTPLTVVLGLVNKAALVLRMIISWIADVSGVLTAVKKIKSILSKIFKTLKNGLKDATILAKEAGKLKPA